MRITNELWSALRGPTLVVLAAGCGTAAEPPPPAPVPAVATAIVLAPPPPDPVAYDVATEAARLARVDADEAAREVARTERLEVTPARLPPRVGPGLIGAPNDWVLAACGRG